jgi:hypothetical protein
MNKKSADLCWFRMRIKQSVFPATPHIAAKEGPALAPAAAADQDQVAASWRQIWWRCLNCKVCSIGD